MVIYFSGTGNSRFIAERIALSLDDVTVCANSYMREGKKGIFESEKSYVFVCPVYAWRIPHAFEAFIKSCVFSGNPKSYFIMTYGGTGIDDAGIFNEKLCIGLELKYMGTFAVRMPENYIIMLRAQSADKAERIITAAEKMIPEISNYILEETKFPKQHRLIIPLSAIANPIFYRLIIKDSGFHATEKCTGCGECVKLCPLGNIRLLNLRPVYGGHCTQCLACICGCPAEAIEYGNLTVGKRRYYLRRK